MLLDSRKQDVDGVCREDWDLSAVYPSVNARNFDEAAKEAIDGVSAQIGLILLGIACAVIRHIRRGDAWFLLTNALVEHQAFDANGEIVVGDNCRLWGLPVNNPVGDERHSEVAIQFGHESVADCRDACIQGSLCRIFNHANDCTFEEECEYVCKVGPDVAINMDFDVSSRNVQIDVDCLNQWNHPSIGKRLFAKSDSSLEFDLLQIDLDAAFGHKDGLLVSEVVAVEGSFEVIDFKNDSVVLDICNELHIIRGRHQNELVVKHVALVTLQVNVRDGQIVDQLDDLIEVDVFRLFDDRDVQRVLDTSIVLGGGGETHAGKHERPCNYLFQKLHDVFYAI